MFYSLDFEPEYILPEYRIEVEFTLPHFKFLPSFQFLFPGTEDEPWALCLLGSPSPLNSIFS